MKNYQEKDEVLQSWRRCMEQNLSAKNISKNIRLEDEELKMLLNKNKILISTFEEIVNNIELNSCLFLYYQMLIKLL